jgi:AmmeMemoRadiSam system protein A
MGRLKEEEKGILLLAARDSIQSQFGESVPSIIDYSRFPSLTETGKGAFVTLTIGHDLRGCIGYLTSDMTLYETICEAAKQAAFNDPRFYPLKEEEFQHMNIEISVLSEITPISSYNEIEIGVHGLVLIGERYKSVLLPQVAVENQFDIPKFLSALCQKAGLEPNTWEIESLDIRVFSAIVFSELGDRKRTYERG